MFLENVEEVRLCDEKKCFSLADCVQGRFKSMVTNHSVLKVQPFNSFLLLASCLHPPPTAGPSSNLRNLMNCFSKPVYVQGRRMCVLDLVVLPVQWEGRYGNKSLNCKSLNTWSTCCLAGCLQSISGAQRKEQQFWRRWRVGEHVTKQVILALGPEV